MRKPRAKSATPPEVDKPVKLSKKNRPEYASDAMAETLRACGFKYAFLNPGSSYRGLHDSLVNYLGNRNPQAVLCTHEDVAVHMAQGYAKATGKPALAILHDLVGLMHGTMGVYNAYCDRVPVVVLGGSGPADPTLRRGIDNLHSANVQGELVRSFVKWDDEGTTVDAVCDSIARGTKIANTGPKAPVYVSIDAGLQEEKLKGQVSIPDMTLPSNRPPAPAGANPDVVKEVADILMKAKNPVIAGGRIMHDHASTRPLVELVELLGASYIDDRGCTCFPTAHKQNLTGVDGVVKKADALLAVDSLDVSVLVDAYSTGERGKTGSGAGGMKVIDLSQNEYMIRSWSRVGGMNPPTTIQMLADPVVGMRQLIEAIKSKQGKRTPTAVTQRKKRIAKAHDDFIKAQQAALKKRWAEVPISPHRLVHEMWEALKGKKWAMGIRSHRAWPHGIWQFNGAGDTIGPSGGGGVGYGPGASVGAAIAAQEQGKFAVALCGDGDFLMSSGALWTAVHMKVPMLFVINNNTSWFNDERHQQNVARMRKRPPENAWIGTTTREPDADLASIARGYGAWAEGPVVDPDSLGPALKRAIKEVEGGAVAVLDVRNSAT